MRWSMVRCSRSPSKQQVLGRGKVLEPIVTSQIYRNGGLRAFALCLR
jgi:hypothetical protein